MNITAYFLKLIIFNWNLSVITYRVNFTTLRMFYKFSLVYILTYPTVRVSQRQFHLSIILALFWTIYITPPPTFLFLVITLLSLCCPTLMFLGWYNTEDPQMRENMRYFSFSVWFNSLNNIMSPFCIHLLANDITLFFIGAQSISIVYIHQILFIHLSIYKYT